MELTPRAEIDTRINDLQILLKEENIDGALILQGVDIFYYTGTFQRGALFVPANGSPVFWVVKSFERACQESALDNLFPTKSLYNIGNVIREFASSDLRSVGIETDVLPAVLYIKLSEQLSGVRLIDISRHIRELRSCKSEYEVSQIKQAAEALKCTYSEIPEFLVKGMREFELAAEIERSLRRKQHPGVIRSRAWNSETFYGFVSSGTSSLRPTCSDTPDGGDGLCPAVGYPASAKPILPGEPVMVDLAGCYNGYIADETRIFCIGELSSALRDAHHFIMEEVLPAIEQLLKPGQLCNEIYGSINQFVGRAGYSDSFMGYGEERAKFVGHGVGLELDEFPVIAERFTMPLKVGNVVAVEPKIFLPTLGGVGVENTYLITPNGPEKLTSFDEDITYIPQ